MFRKTPDEIPRTHGFPRVCGDVPHEALAPYACVRFSPRMRGCSYLEAKKSAAWHVFPAYAGMFRRDRPSGGAAGSFPRVCGDVPYLRKEAQDLSGFSPRMRGCSCYTPLGGGNFEVFPAYAGMFRTPRKKTAATSCFPRVCGDVPAYQSLYEAFSRFSPRMRGCSAGIDVYGKVSKVFPAYAGMFLDGTNIESGGTSFPRVCGDVPAHAGEGRFGLLFSPRMRGCSES